VDKLIALVDTGIHRTIADSDARNGQGGNIINQQQLHEKSLNIPASPAS